MKAYLGISLFINFVFTLISGFLRKLCNGNTVVIFDATGPTCLLYLRAGQRYKSRVCPLYIQPNDALRHDTTVSFYAHAFLL